MHRRSIPPPWPPRCRGLRIVDVSDPGAPFELSYFDTVDLARNVCVAGPFAYVADYGDGVIVVDVSNPEFPFQTGYYDTGGRALDVDVLNDKVLVADDRNGVALLGNEAIPVFLAYLRADRVSGGVMLRWQVAWQDGNEGFLVERRVADGIWQRLTGVAIPSAGGMDFSYLDSTAPSVALEYRLIEQDDLGQERVLRSVSVGATAGALAQASLSAFPNPFNPQTTLKFTMPMTEHARLSIHDVMGRRLRLLHDGPLAAGAATFSWNGRDEAGNALPSGVYLARLHTPQGDWERKLVMAR